MLKTQSYEKLWKRRKERKFQVNWSPDLPVCESLAHCSHYLMAMTGGAQRAACTPSSKYWSGASQYSANIWEMENWRQQTLRFQSLPCCDFSHQLSILDHYFSSQNLQTEIFLISMKFLQILQSTDPKKKKGLLSSSSSKYDDLCTSWNWVQCPGNTKHSFLPYWVLTRLSP